MDKKKKLLNAAPEAWTELSPWPWIPWVEGYYFRDPVTEKESLAWGGSPVVLDARGRTVCEPDRSHRDAFLIAAAPELLAALRLEHTITAAMGGKNRVRHRAPDGSDAECSVCSLVARAEGRGFRQYEGDAEYEGGAGNAIEGMT